MFPVFSISQFAQYLALLGAAMVLGRITATSHTVPGPRPAASA
jgi:hypothetical protein